MRVTHSYVLGEFVALAQARRLPRMAALTFVSDLVENRYLDPWVDEALHREAMALLVARPDKTYSLCDAVSFVFMGSAASIKVLNRSPLEGGGGLSAAGSSDRDRVRPSPGAALRDRKAVDAEPEESACYPRGRIRCQISRSRAGYGMSPN